MAFTNSGDFKNDARGLLEKIAAKLRVISTSDSEDVTQQLLDKIGEDVELMESKFKKQANIPKAGIESDKEELEFFSDALVPEKNKEKRETLTKAIFVLCENMERKMSDRLHKLGPQPKE